MSFRMLFVCLLVGLGSTLYGQSPSNHPHSTIFRHDRFIGVGHTLLSTTRIQTVSLELGVALTLKIQAMGGPKFFIHDYLPYTATSNAFGSFYGGFAGLRFWWQSMPSKGWSGFTAVELHYSMPSLGGNGFSSAAERRILGPEIGNGFGRFSPSGFYFLFNFNFGVEKVVVGQVVGDVYGNLRLSTGLRF